jgi:hypothetical protein
MTVAIDGAGGINSTGKHDFDPVFFIIISYGQFVYFCLLNLVSLHFFFKLNVNKSLQGTTNQN